MYMYVHVYDERFYSVHATCICGHLPALLTNLFAQLASWMQITCVDQLRNVVDV